MGSAGQRADGGPRSWDIPTGHRAATKRRARRKQRHGRGVPKCRDVRGDWEGSCQRGSGGAFDDPEGVCRGPRHRVAARPRTGRLGARVDDDCRRTTGKSLSVARPATSDGCADATSTAEFAVPWSRSALRRRPGTCRSGIGDTDDESTEARSLTEFIARRAQRVQRARGLDCQIR